MAFPGASDPSEEIALVGQREDKILLYFILFYFILFYFILFYRENAFLSMHLSFEHTSRYQVGTGLYGLLSDVSLSCYFLSIR